VEIIILNKILEALIEVQEKGSLQEQAFDLCKKEKTYKKLIAEYNRQLNKIDGINIPDLLRDLELMKFKYETRLSNVRQEMCVLNKRIIDTIGVIEEFMDADVFIETFGIEYDEWDSEERFYSNLIGSDTSCGHVCRVALIYYEKSIKEMIFED
jgi:hypothetical protein